MNTENNFELLDQFLSMYSLNFGKNRDEDFAEMVAMYIDVEGESKMSRLRKEIKQIETEKDWNELLKLAKENGLKTFDVKALKRLTRIVVGYFHQNNDSYETEEYEEEAYEPADEPEY